MVRNLRTPALIIALVIGGVAYAGSVRGWGVGGLQDPATMSVIKKNCPNYYQSRDGACLGRTFRSYYLFRGVTGGGPGYGK
ncbi:MAG: hypothetical protein AAFR61_10660 [Bacteroidota bacterium]